METNHTTNNYSIVDTLRYNDALDSIYSNSITSIPIFNFFFFFFYLSESLACTIQSNLKGSFIRHILLSPFFVSHLVFVFERYFIKAIIENSTEYGPMDLSPRKVLRHP